MLISNLHILQLHLSVYIYACMYTLKSVWFCVCIYVCKFEYPMHMCKSVYIQLCIYMYNSIRMCIYVQNMYISVYTCFTLICVYICVCNCVCAYVCMYVCM